MAPYLWKKKTFSAEFGPEDYVFPRELGSPWAVQLLYDVMGN
jgi:hypothetical protein